MDFNIDPQCKPTYDPGVPVWEIPRIIGDNPEGFLFVDKPLQKTSHDIVSWGRRLVGTKKVGHAGTLDPDASGMLILGLGRATKFIQYLQGMSKTYTARIRFGQTTSTEDAAGKVLESKTVPTGLELEPYLAQFRGEYLQVPSSVSAKKIAGKRAYQLVREGKSVELAPIPVQIYDLRAISQLEPVVEQGVQMYEIEIQVCCSAGTYIRALARDLGDLIGVGGHLRALRRVSVGPYRVEKDCYSISDLVNRRLADKILPIVKVDQVVGKIFSQIELSEEELRDLSFGKMVKQKASDMLKLSRETESDGTGSSGIYNGENTSDRGIFAASFMRARHGKKLVALVKSRHLRGESYWQPVFVWTPQIRE